MFRSYSGNIMEVILALRSPGDACAGEVPIRFPGMSCLKVSCPHLLARRYAAGLKVRSAEFEQPPDNSFSPHFTLILIPGSLPALMVDSIPPEASFQQPAREPVLLVMGRSPTYI
jgi:hypothetical protein